jgi:hypothetical protein
MKNILVMSAPSVEMLLKMIADYFYCKTYEVVIYEITGKEVKTRKDFYHGTVYKNGKKLDNYVVKRVKDRYRFEQIA